MEITTSYTNHDDLADALRGAHGKDVGQDYKISYLGTVIVGQGKMEVLDKNCKIKHYEWQAIGTDLYLAFVK